MRRVRITKSNIIPLTGCHFMLLFLIAGCNGSSDKAESLDEYIANNKPLITAHRGYAAIAPENTLAAFKKAVLAGADATEFDVHISKDGTLVVIHDDSVDRTTNGTGNISDLSDEYLKSLDAGGWKSDEFNGEEIPTLEETLTYLEANNMVALLEIKAPGIVDDIVAMLYSTGMDKRTLIVTFDEDAVKEIKNKYPEISALLFLPPAYSAGTTDEITLKMMAKAEEIGTKDIGPFAFLVDKLTAENINKISTNEDPGDLALALNSEAISILQENGYRIDAWTVDSEENIRDLIESNVDILTTNYLERAIALKKAH